MMNLLQITSPLLLGLALVWVQKPLHAAPLVIQNGFKEADGLRHITVLADPANQWTLQDILAAKAPFVAPPPQGSHGINKGSIWIRLAVSNGSSQPTQAFWTFEGPTAEQIDFYVVRDGRILASHHAGFLRPIGDWPNSFTSPTFPLNLAVEESLDFFAKITGTHVPVSVATSITTEQSFFQRIEEASLFRSLFLGLMLSVTCYNLVVWIASKAVSHLIYAIFIVFETSTLLCLTGNNLALAPWVPQELLAWQARLSGAGLIFWTLIFCHSYLDLKNRDKAWGQMGLVLAGLVVPSSCVQITAPTLGITVLMLLTLLAAGWCVASGVKSIAQGYQPARLYLLAWLGLAAVGVTYTLGILGAIALPSNIHAALLVAGSYEALLLSFGLYRTYNSLTVAQVRAESRIASNLKETIDCIQAMARTRDPTEIEERAYSALRSGLGWGPALQIRVEEKANAAAGIEPLGLPPELAAGTGAAPGSTSLPSLTIPLKQRGSQGNRALHLSVAPPLAFGPGDSEFVKAILGPMQLCLANAGYLSTLKTQVENQAAKINFLLDHIPEAVLSFGPQLTLDAEFSAFLPVFYALDPSTVPGRDLFAAMFPGISLSDEKVAEARGRLEAAFRKGVAWFLAEASSLFREAEIDAAMGRRLVAVDWAPITSDGIALESVMVTIRDITDEAALRRKREQSEERQRRTLDVAVKILSAERHAVSAYFLRLTSWWAGISIQTLLGDSRGQALRVLSENAAHARSLGLDDLATHCLALAASAAASETSLGAAFTSLGTLIEHYDRVLRRDLNILVHQSSNAHSRLLALMKELCEDLNARMIEAGQAPPQFALEERTIDWDTLALLDVLHIVTHALNNAVDHGFIASPQKIAAPSLAVSLTVQGAKVHLTIADNGCGIAAAHLNPQLLQRHQPHDTATNATEHGTLVPPQAEPQPGYREGLGRGLAAIAFTAGKLAGEARLTMLPEGGTQLSICLPLARLSKGLGVAA